MTTKPLFGTGLGLRDEHISSLVEAFPNSIDFMEVAPENWIKSPFKPMDTFASLAKQVPIIAHGLSLSLGGPQPLDFDFLVDLKEFMQTYQLPLYSEHLTYCSYNGQLYDLLPIPFTEEAVHYVAKRIRDTQDFLEQRIGVENPSYYCAPGQKMREVDFINAVIAEAKCDLLLDVNNVYVNSVNHNYDPKEFIDQLKPSSICYIHIAGHWKKQDNLIIDTHGDTIINPVWDLLEHTYQNFGVTPTLIERDNDIPPLAECLDEIEIVKSIQAKCTKLETNYV